MLGHGHFEARPRLRKAVRTSVRRLLLARASVQKKHCQDWTALLRAHRANWCRLLCTRAFVDISSLYVFYSAFYHKKRVLNVIFSIQNGRLFRIAQHWDSVGLLRTGIPKLAPKEPLTYFSNFSRQ